MEYTEYITKFTYSRFNRKWNFTQCFLKFDSFRALGSARTLTVITRRVAYLPKLAPHITVALELLNMLISVTFHFGKMRYDWFSHSGSQICLFAILV